MGPGLGPAPTMNTQKTRDKMRTSEVKKRLTEKKKTGRLKQRDYISTGSTLLNLSLTNEPNLGFAKGHYYLIVGTSKSGKTWLTLSCLAEATLNKAFDKHYFVFDDVERGALMDMKKFFGRDVVRRLKFRHSYTVEEFYDNLTYLYKKDIPFIYILDSMDALSSKQEITTYDKQRKARADDKKEKGSYGDGKAKVNSQNLRRAMKPLDRTGSILLVINQTRDKLTGFGGKTRSGGNALQFYATMEIWSDIKEPLSKIYKAKKRTQGNLCKLRVRKNRVTGNDREVFVPIYNTYGIDDVGSCIDYLVSEKHWKKTKSGIIHAPEFDEFEGKSSVLISHILNNNMERKLSGIVGDVWKDIEQAVAIKRKPRYV
jgi:RecA/RadA recombinase